MRSVRSTPTWRPTLWALALSTLLLTGCGVKPTTRPSRTRPEAAMVKPTRPDPPPANLSQLPAEQQATIGFQLYRSMADYAGQLEKKYDVLVHWINGDTP